MQPVWVLFLKQKSGSSFIDQVKRYRLEKNTVQFNALLLLKAKNELMFDYLHAVKKFRIETEIIIPKDCNV